MKSYWQLIYGVFVLVLLGFAVYAGWRNRALKRQQDALAEKQQGKRFWRVNLARTAYGQKFLKFLPFESKGLLVLEENQVRILGAWTTKGAPFDWVLPVNDCGLEWLGNTALRSGNLYWARIVTPEGPINFCADTGMYALPSREALSDIFRSAFPAYPLGASATRDFSLEKNTRSLAVVALFFVLLAFALLDTYVFSSFELVDAQISSLLSKWSVRLGGVVALLTLLTLSYRFLSAGQVPARESLALSLMLSLVGVGACLPVLKRVDQLLATAPSKDHAYAVQYLGYLEPVDSTQGLPNMRFKRANEYWSLFPAGSEYKIPFLRGPMGLWQLDHSKFDPPIYKFYTEGSGKK